MRTTLLTILLSVSFFACKSKNKIPGDILARDKMQAILWDMMRADQFITNYALAKDSSLDKKAESIKYYQQIFTIHQVDKKAFQKSFSYYQSHPELLKDIMDSLSRPPKALPTKIITPSVEDTVLPTTGNAGDKKDTAAGVPKKPKKARFD